MGARVIFNIKHSNEMYVCIYSHWGEDTRYQDLARAIDVARPRWDDESYFTRILISQLVNNDWNQELHYGVWPSSSPCLDETNIEIDLTDKTVMDVSGLFTFSEFVKAFLREVVNA